MTERKLAYVLFAAVSLAMLVTTPAIACKATEGYGGKDSSHADYGHKALNMTDEQKEKSKEIHEKYKAAVAEQKEVMAKERERLRELMAGNADDEAIREQHEKLQKARNDLSSTRFEKLLAMRSILTSEQRKNLGAWSGHYSDKPHGKHERKMDRP